MIIANHFVVSLAGGDHVVIQMPAQRYTAQDAVLLAAWLVAVSSAVLGPDQAEETFRRMLAEIQAT